MRILVLGGDGYIGWPLTLSLLNDGHEVAVLDNYSRRDRVCDIGSASLTPLMSPRDRLHYLRSKHNFIDEMAEFNLSEHPNYIHCLLNEIEPEAIIHLAEQPSAPWSMIDPICSYNTQYENVIGTLNLLWAIKYVCPSAHLIKLGTMGEYGTPDCNIPEGKIPNECIGQGCISGTGSAIHCPMSGLQFPRQPGSFYHASKVMDSVNIDFACRTWGLTSTDIMQGVVYGLADTKEHLLTRLDYDEYFGTAINRFCAQALINHPLTIYGEGNQTRGFLPLRDSINCIKLILANPPSLGTYRTINQYADTYSINYLAEIVSHISNDIGLTNSSLISHITNPRVESSDHYYRPSNDTLQNLGYEPTTTIHFEIYKLLTNLQPYTSNIRKEVILPKTNWRF